MTQVPGYSSIETTALDPVNINSGGIIGLDNSDGSQTRPIQLYVDNAFNKSNGLGDLEYLGEVAPIEIGNRVWDDADADGIRMQEKAESMVLLLISTTILVLK